MEQPQINPIESRTNPLPDETILIQAKLIKKSKEDSFDWILKNADDFRKIIEANPNLIKQYQENPEAVENFINEQLQKKELFH